MESKALIAQVEKLIEPIVVEEGLELVDVVWTFEFGSKILRVLIDKESGPITVDDCTRVSHSVEDLLEVKGVIPSRYNLEVSSPGVNRPLKKKHHFARAIGKMVRLQTKAPIDGRKNYKGILKEVRGDDLVMEIDTKDYLVPIGEVSKANLEIL